MNFEHIKSRIQEGKTLQALKEIKTYYEGIPLKKAKELVDAIVEGALNANQFQKAVASYKIKSQNYESNFSKDIDYRLINNLKSLVSNDQLITAIKELREMYPHLSLNESKDFITKLKAGNITDYQVQTLLDNQPKYTQAVSDNPLITNEEQGTKIFSYIIIAIFIILCLFVIYFVGMWFVDNETY
jgi:ribosomal protein L7/L12